MRISFVLLLILFLAISLNSQTNWYVSQEIGDDTNTGTSASAPFETIDKVVSSVSAGDQIFLMGKFKNPSYNSNFTYTNEHDPHLWHKENTIRINDLHGNASNYITFKAYDSSTLLKGDGANIFRITNCSYLKIEDFEIKGEVNRIPLSTAEALQFVYIDADAVANEFDPTAAEIRYRDEDCVSNCVAGTVTEDEVYTDIDDLSTSRPSFTDTRGLYLSDVHHIDILNNEIHHMPGGGLRVAECEDINIIGNEVHNCSRKSYSGTHGLVVTKAESTRTTNDYRINILKNKVHHNYNEIFSWSPAKTKIKPHIDEGKGISLQRNETTNQINWDNGKILVANNICYLNGFSGIHSNDGNRIDIINNTCYFNSYTKSIYAPTTGNGGNIGISCQGGSSIKILNNISVIDSDLNQFAISSNITGAQGLVVANNIIYGTNGTINEDSDVVLVQSNTQMVDPQFENASASDFTLQSSSPAIDMMGITDAPTDDFSGQTRDATPDLGAMEFLLVALPVELLFFEVQLNEEKEAVIKWATATETNNAFFVVEKSKDGIRWEALGKLKGFGQSSSLQHYDFLDTHPFDGISYYRLQQVDFDGRFEYSEIRSVNNKSFASVLIYPNPVSTYLILESEKIPLVIDQIKIYDVLGREILDGFILEKESAFKIRIEFSRLNRGTYFLKNGDVVQIFQKEN